MPSKPVGKVQTPEAQLRAFVGKRDPKTQKLFRAVRTAMRKRFPTANELAYDYSHALVIGYAPAEHGIEAIVAIRADDRGVSLYFNQGPRLPDPKQLLRGSGKQTRYIPLASARQLAEPEVQALITATIDQAKVPLPTTGKGRLIIKTDGSQKPPRRKPSK